MNNALKILNLLDRKIDSRIELTLYGRAALQLGFERPLREFALSMDVDAVFQTGQAEILLETTNFWEAVEEVNRELADQELYISHFFEESQVILRSDWRNHRKKIRGDWQRLDLFRLGDVDLLLSKLMRSDPIDTEDAIFIFKNAPLDRETVIFAIQNARIPNIPEIKEEFLSACSRFWERLSV